MSGRFPFEVGISHTIFQRERLAPAVVTFPQALQKAGYKTGLFGKWHLGDEDAYLPQNRGFDEVLMHGAGGIGQYGFGDFEANNENTYFDSMLLHNDTVVKTKGFCTDLFFRAALAWIRDQSRGEAPWFSYISLNAPHSPMIAPQKYKQRFLDLGFDDRAAGRYGMIENIDDNVGLLMDTLEEWKLLESTLVIFMTDNGMAMRIFTIGDERVEAFNAGMRGGKAGVDEGGTRVPSFWSWKGTLGEGVDIPALTAHIDIYKTFCDLAGAAIPESALPPAGRSLVPLMENPSAEWPDRKLFFHRGRWGGNARNALSREEMQYKGCAVRTSRWRLVEHERLYDIPADPGQIKDVAAGHPEVVESLRRAYDAWWKSTEPLLVSEGLPKIEPGNFALHRRYIRQASESGIPEWDPQF